MFQRFVRRQPLGWIDAQQFWNQILHLGTQPQMFARVHGVVPHLNVPLHHLKQNKSSNRSVYMQHKRRQKQWPKRRTMNICFPPLTAVASSISAPSSVLNGIPWQTKMYSTTPQLHMSQACPYPTPMSSPFKVAHLLSKNIPKKSKKSSNQFSVQWHK